MLQLGHEKNTHVGERKEKKKKAMTSAEHGKAESQVLLGRSCDCLRREGGDMGGWG